MTYEADFPLRGQEGLNLTKQYNETYMILLNCELQIYGKEAYQNTRCLICKPFLVFDCLYVNGIFWNWFGLKFACI